LNAHHLSRPAISLVDNYRFSLLERTVYVKIEGNLTVYYETRFKKKGTRYLRKDAKENVTQKNG